MIDFRIFTKDKVNNAGSAGRSFRSGSAYADVSARISAIEAALSGKVDTAFWDRIFRAHGRGEDSDGNMVARDVAPNDVATEITDIESLVSLWTTGGITALGTGPVGTGSNGGTGSLGSLLVSLNDSGLSLPAAGGYLHYNGSAWEWTEGGGESVDLSNYLQKRTYLDANGFYKNNHYYRLEDEGANVTIATRTWVKNELGNTDLTDYIKKNTVAEVDSLKRGDYFYNLPVVKDNVTLADRDWVSSQISGLGAGTVTSVGTVSNVPGLTLTGGPVYNPQVWITKTSFVYGNNPDQGDILAQESWDTFDINAGEERKFYLSTTPPDGTSCKVLFILNGRVVSQTLVMVGGFAQT